MLSLPLPCPTSAFLAYTAPQQILEADIVLWIAGQSPVTKAAAATDTEARPSLPFATNGRGRMQTDATLRVLNHQRVFALGDVAVRWDLGWGGQGCALGLLSVCVLG